VDPQVLLDQIASGNVIALIPRQRTTSDQQAPTGLPARKWHSMAEVAEMLGYGLSKVKMLVITGELRSVKDGKYRRILPEWVDEYVARKAREAA
jgi:excisionase family DNA binding protein